MMHKEDDVGHVLIRVKVFFKQLELRFRDGSRSLDFGLALGGGQALGRAGRLVLAIEGDETGIAIAERAIGSGHVLSVEVLHGLRWRLLAVIHFMVARRVENRNAGAGGDAQKFLVLVVDALGMLWGLPGDGISGPEHEGRGRIHSLYCTEDIAGNGRLGIARVRWTVVSGQDKDEFACVCWL